LNLLAIFIFSGKGIALAFQGKKYSLISKNIFSEIGNAWITTSPEVEESEFCCRGGTQ